MRRPRRDPWATSGLVTGVAFVAAITGAIRLANSPYPRPGTAAQEVRSYYRDSTVAARYSAAAQLVSVLSLARFTLSAARLAHDSSARPGLARAATLASGGAAVVALTASAATHAWLTLPETRSGLDDDELVQASRRVFALGGPVHGVGYGAFIGLLTQVARGSGLVGPAGATAGWVSSAAGLCSPAFFRWENAGWLIPIGRFAGYVVSGLVGVRLARGTVVDAG